jgi:4-amino-4-deoxy-L-arabinose transferase-like glycosyltransferase
MRTRFTLWTIWCCFLGRALFYCAAVPLWEGYDEYSHFALVQYVATHHGRFPLGAVPPNISRAISESRSLTPGAWVIHDAGSGILSYEEYFSLPPVEQNARRGRLENLPVEWYGQEAARKESLYEAQQPPLYYWILAPFYWLMQGWSIPSMVWVLRSLTVLIASTAVPLAFVAGRQVLRDDAMALGIALVAASFPELFIVIGHVSNEGLSVATGALFVVMALRTVEATPSASSGLGLGIALGAALLTKAYFLALIPLAAVVLCYAWLDNKASRRQAVWQAAMALASCVAISGWWYIHNLLITGTLTGQFEDAQGMANSKVSLLRAVGQSHWARVFDMVIVSHIWLGDWSFLGLRAWMYRGVELMMVAAIAGVCIQAVRERPGLPQPRELGLLALPYLTMVVGLCFHAAQVFRARGSAATVGYYLYALVVPEAILLTVGIARLMPGRKRLLAVPIVAFVLIGLEQFGAWFVLFPYYAGLIRHNPNGGLPTARIRQLWNGGSDTFFLHLSGIGPASPPAVVAALAVVFALATAVLLWSAYRIVAPARASVISPD